MGNIQAWVPDHQPTPRLARTVGQMTPINDITTSLLATEVGELTRWELLVMVSDQRVLDWLLPADVIARLRHDQRDVRILHSSGVGTRSTHCAGLAHDAAMLMAGENLPHFTAVRDRAVVYLPAQAQRPSVMVTHRVIRLRNPVLAELLATAFDVMSAQQARLREVPAEGPHGDVLRVLSYGLTDERAAVRLHISNRTFARRVAALMEHLEARSRFQAGVHAARRGLV